MKQRLRVAILWHFHQPDYRQNGQAVLPWVRLHATKDYAELPAIHRDYPSLRLTYNVTPILLEQLDAYRKMALDDEHGALSRTSAALLTASDRERLVQWAFIGNAERMIEPYPRYRYLRDTASNVQRWTLQDILDTQVWMRLAWLGETTRQTPLIAQLIAQGENFSADDIARLYALEQGLIVSFFERLHYLEQRGIAELTTSPYYHPILPLLCTTTIVTESDPDLVILNPPFAWREDALEQVRRAQQAAQQYFGLSVRGMWLSEGGISDDALDVLTECGLTWTASDQYVLARSLGQHRPTWRYQPFLWERGSRRIVVFFRDTALSDAIGFEYSAWDAEQAASDFVARLHRLRHQILDQEGAEFLARACVPIILDGENCWEFYQRNGEPFLRALYHALTTDELIETVTFNQLARQALTDPTTPILQHIRAGSWIGGSFRIWIGHEEDRHAWSLLRDARAALATVEQSLSPDAREQAYRHLLTAEGSDWFWWYGDEHRAAFRALFDELFRFHIAKAYQAMGKIPPPTVATPLIQQEANVHTSFGSMHRGTILPM